MNIAQRNLASVSSSGFIVLLLSAFASRAAGQESQTWAFNPPRDTFSADAAWDLRSMNEREAGASGYITMKDGDFVRGDGQPIRFWPVNTTIERSSHEEIAHHARWLAKRGVNMVRWHGFLHPKGKESAITEVDEKGRDECWKLVAGMKKEGIYVTISPYWANAAKIQPSWKVPEVPDSTGKSGANGLLFFDETMQRGYKAWLRAWLAEPNPYTGIPLAKDPAVAIIQLQNEDSLLFWTLQSIPEGQRRVLGRRFGEFAAKKYGSLAAAVEAWKPFRVAGDDISAGVLAMAGMWEYGSPASGGKDQRLADQLEFLTRTMEDFNKQIVRYLREELGCKSLINAGNWKTANTAQIGDAERYAYAACDVLAVNRYFTGLHLGDKRGWAIDKDDRFTNASALLDPLQMPINVKQLAGYPFVVTESNWVPPLLWQSEAPLLVAAYESLTGQDGYYWFSDGAVEWQQPASANGFVPAIGKWIIGTPTVLGQFPAAALMFRRGDIARGEPAVVESRTMDDLWHRRGIQISEETSYDPGRDEGDAAVKNAFNGPIDPLAFFVGPVVSKLGAKQTGVETVELKRYIDRENHRVHSVTGQLMLDYGHGYCTLDAPKAQGVCGFLSSQGLFDLQAVTIESTNEYASVLVVSLDDQPLADAKRVLVQVGTTARPTGWQEEALEFTPETGSGKKGPPVKGLRVVSFGKAPWQVAGTEVTVELANSALRRATLLDVNGMRQSEVPAQRKGGRLVIQLPADSLYVLVE